MARHQSAIIGDGGWGTALALQLYRAGHAVRVWSPFPDYLEKIRASSCNSLYLPDVQLPEAIKWTADEREAVSGADRIICAVPSQYAAAVLRRFQGLVPANARVLSVTKGLDPETQNRITCVAESCLKCGPVAMLSGPSHAEEVARGQPTAVVVAATEPVVAQDWQNLFTAGRFRVYTSPDVIGVELGGVLKNVIALAVGVSDGVGFGDNTRAALITRGLAEITRLGCALGARPETFAGLSGVGDLIVTCTSRLSRNHAVGERLGHGESIDSILAGMRQVAEGVTTCAQVRTLARAANVATPITDAVHALLYENKTPLEMVEALLARRPRPEEDFNNGGQDGLKHRGSDR